MSVGISEEVCGGQHGRRNDSEQRNYFENPSSAEQNLVDWAGGSWRGCNFGLFNVQAAKITAGIASFNIRNTPISMDSRLQPTVERFD